MNQNLTRGVLALVDQALVSVNSFATIILVAQLGDVRDVSLYALAWSILNVVRVIQERAISVTYLMIAHQRSTNPVTFLGSSFVQQVILGLVSSAIFLLLAVLCFVLGRPQQLDGCLVVMALASPFILLRDHLRAVSTVNFKYSSAVALSVIALLSQLLLILSADWFGLFDVRVVLLSMGVSSLLACAYWFHKRPVEFKISSSELASDFRRSFQFAKWLVAARVFPTTAVAVLPWIVWGTVSEAATGILATCMTLSNLTSMFVTGANNYFQPKTTHAFHHHGPAAMRKILRESAVAYGMVLSIFTCGLWIFGDGVLGLLFGPEFIGYRHLVGLLALQTLITAFSTVAGNGMSALGKPEGLFWGEAAYALTLIVVAFSLSPTYGLIGTGLASCIAAGVSTLVAVANLVLAYGSAHGDKLVAQESIP